MSDEIEEILARNEERKANHYREACDVAAEWLTGIDDIDRLLEIIAEKDRQAATLLKHAADTIEHKANVIAEKDEEIRLDDILIADRDKVLEMLLCPDHGRCVPHAKNEIERMRLELAEKDAEIARLKATLVVQLPEEWELLRGQVGRVHEEEE
jgi:hypothetical protein